MRRMLLALVAGLAVAVVVALTLTAVESGRRRVSSRDDMASATASGPAPVLPVSDWLVRVPQRRETSGR
jgi:hypothetical protein